MSGALTDTNVDTKRIKREEPNSIFVRLACHFERATVLNRICASHVELNNFSDLHHLACAYRCPSLRITIPIHRCTGSSDDFLKWVVASRRSYCKHSNGRIFSAGQHHCALQIFYMCCHNTTLYASHTGAISAPMRPICATNRFTLDPTLIMHVLL